MSRLFYPEILESGNTLNITDNGDETFTLDPTQDALIQETRIQTEDYAVGERTFDMGTGSFTSQTVHFRYSLNGSSINTFTPPGKNIFYVIDSAATTYNPNNALDAGITENFDGAFGDETTQTNSAAAGDMTLLPASPVVSDAFFFGSATQFTRLRINVSTAFAGTSLVITWEYSTGSDTWTALSGVTDGTNNYDNTGTNDIIFTLPTDWVTDTVNSQGPFFYVRGRATTVTGPTTAPVGTQAFVGEDEAQIVSNADDLLIARIVVSGSDTITSITPKANNSKLVVDSVESVTSKSVTSQSSTVSAVTLTLNSGEAGAGIAGGTGEVSIIGDRGSLSNYELTWDDNTDMLTTGIIGNKLTVPRFADTPLDGRVLFTDLSVGDEIATDTLYWDKTSNRLGIGTANAADTLDVNGGVRCSSGYMSRLIAGFIQFNADLNQDRIVTGFASKFEGLNAGGFRLRVSSTGVAGTAITFTDAIEANFFGDIGIKMVPSTTYAMSITGDLFLQNAEPIITVLDTGAGNQGLRIQIDGVSIASEQIFRIIDIQGGATTVMEILKSGDTTHTIDKSFAISATSTTAQMMVDISNGTAAFDAKIRIDASNGDFVGNDWVEFYQESSTLNLYMVSRESAGNVIIGSKFNGTTFIGSIGINKVPTQAFDIEGTTRITRSVGFPALVLEDPTQSNKQFHLWQNASNFHIGPDSTGTVAFSIETDGDVTMGTTEQFFFDRSTDRLGLGLQVATPLHQLHIEHATDLNQVFIKGRGAGTGIIMDTFINTGPNSITFRKLAADAFVMGMIGNGASTPLFNIVNSGTTNTSFQIDGANDDITYQGDYFWDATNSQLILGTKVDTGLPTFRGTLRIEGDSALGANGGIEFKTSGTTSGYGSRMFVDEDVGLSTVALSIAHRVNDTAWTEVFKITRDLSGTPFNVAAISGNITVSGNATMSGAKINISGIPEHADDSAAGSGGLITGDIYKTTSGDAALKVKT